MSEKLKTAYLKRLANVKCTPLLALYDNFYDYHPDGSDEEYKACERNFFEAAEFGEVDFIGERWNLTQYRGEGAASKVRRDREAEEAKNKELYE